jgi:flagellar protein FliS
MTTRYAPDAYQQMQVLSSDPRMLVLLLCQALVRNLLRARRAIESGDYEEKSLALTQASDILDELICSLRVDVGGELAQNLCALYAHLQAQLVEVDLRDDLDRLGYVDSIAGKLANAWEEALERCQQQTQAA